MYAATRISSWGLGSSACPLCEHHSTALIEVVPRGIFAKLCSPIPWALYTNKGSNHGSSRCQLQLQGVHLAALSDLGCPCTDILLNIFTPSACPLPAAQVSPHTYFRIQTTTSNCPPIPLQMVFSILISATVFKRCLAPTTTLNCWFCLLVLLTSQCLRPVTP